MMVISKTNFVKQYKPGEQSRVELKNGRIMDVVNGRYYDAGTRIILQGGKIKAMPGLSDESTAVKPDFSIDLAGDNLRQITYDEVFDAFPMFSHDGRSIVFSSNRNNGGTRNTNIFIADWIESGQVVQ